MPRRIENPDGIYPVVKVPLDELTEADHQWTQREMAVRFDWETLSVAILKWAKQVVGAEFANADSRADARHVMVMVDQEIPAAVARGDINSVLATAFAVGRLCERIHARHFEKQVVQVNSTTGKLRAAAAEQAHAPQDIANAIKLYRRLLKKKPAPKKSAVEKQVEEKTGIPPRTLRRHLKNNP